MLPLDDLFDAGAYQRHYVDLPGSGESQRLKRMTAELVVDSVAQYIDENLLELPFVIVGASFGGFVARCLHARYSSRILGSALLAPAVRPPGQRQLDVERSAYESDGFDQLVDDSERAHVTSFKSMSPLHTRGSFTAYLKHIVPGYLVHDADAYARLRQSYDPATISKGSEPGLLGGRNLILTGKRDSVVGWKDQVQIVDEYQNASYVVLEGAGHNVHLDQPEIVHLLIRHWLRGL